MEGSPKHPEKLSQGGIFELDVESKVVHPQENKDVRYEVETDDKYEERLGCWGMHNGQEMSGVSQCA